ncbi:MAG: nucleotidyltransferase domain-containing protein [Cyanobacteria bacterium P01_D01_bin.36]
MTIPAATVQNIQAELSRLEREESIKILFAVESGSRAWGFPSKDSDYDVRFVYARRPWDYINVYRQRDVIERPITDELDISGWDLNKAFGLLRKSNPALMEWVRSPLIYKEAQPHADRFRQLAEEAFLPLASCYHYCSMARQHQMRTAKKTQVSLKKYLYTLRPCLAAMWVIERGTQPPMLFSELVEAYLPSGELRRVVDELVTIKSSATEKDSVERLPMLDTFIEESVVRIGENLPAQKTAMRKDECNELFRQMLREYWDE